MDVEMKSFADFPTLAEAVGLYPPALSVPNDAASMLRYFERTTVGGDILRVGARPDNMDPCGKEWFVSKEEAESAIEARGMTSIRGPKFKLNAQDAADYAAEQKFTARSGTRLANSCRVLQMTSDQKQALRMMSEQNIGAVVTRFGWTWPETVRNNEEAAGEVIRILSTRNEGLGLMRLPEGLLRCL